MSHQLEVVPARSACQVTSSASAEPSYEVEHKNASSSTYLISAVTPIKPALGGEERSAGSGRGSAQVSGPGKQVRGPGSRSPAFTDKPGPGFLGYDSPDPG